MGWADRSPTGVGTVIHTEMQWSVNSTTYAVSTNIVYQIPMAMVYGDSDPFPVGVVAMLHFDTD